MSTKIKEQPVPKWFIGQIYDKGGVVNNRFGGDSIELNNIELSMYDYVMGASIMMEIGLHDDRSILTLRKGLDWFRKHSPKAYMVLLD